MFDLLNFEFKYTKEPFQNAEKEPLGSREEDTFEEPCQMSVMECFCENSEWVLVKRRWLLSQKKVHINIRHSLKYATEK